MTHSRTAAVSLTALLAIGGTTVLTAGLAAAQTDPTSPSTAVDPTTTTVPAIPTDIAITLPGLGDVALSVDPGTGAIVSVTVTPIDGVTASDPVPVHHGVQLTFTLADGSVQAIVVEVHVRDGAVKVEIEPADDDYDDEYDDDYDDDHTGPPPIDERGNSAEHRNDDNDHSQGEHRGTPTTTVGESSSTTPSSPTSPRQERDDDDDDDGEDSSDSTMQSGTGSRGR